MVRTTTRLDRPVYGLCQAAQLLNLPVGTVRRWVEGYTHAGVDHPPLLREEATGAELVTWGEFVEAGCLVEYRRRRVGLQHLQPVLSTLRQRLGTSSPLAHAQLLTTDAELVVSVQEEVELLPEARVLVGVPGRPPALSPAAAAFTDKIEFTEPDTGIVRRLFPLGRAARVTLDPDCNLGEPSVGGVRTEILAEHVAAGTSPDTVAASYDLDVEDVNAAVSYEQEQASNQSLRRFILDILSVGAHRSPRRAVDREPLGVPALPEFVTGGSDQPPASA